MRLRVLLWGSVALNIILGAALLQFYSRHSTPRPDTPENAVSGNGASPLVKTNLVVRRQNFVWADIESDDYHRYIEKLRSIACPEPTIRDIILAEVNSLFQRRRITEIAIPEQRWWRSEPDLEAQSAFAAQETALENERRALLAELLGPEWDREAIPSGFRILLDGPVLGALAPEVKEALYRLEQDRRSARPPAESPHGVTDHPPPAGGPMVDREKEHRRQLVALLSPPELEEYLLRYSAEADALRSELQGFEATPGEFRGLFRARQAIAEQVESYPDTPGSGAALKLGELKRQGDITARQILGPERYQLLVQLRDPLFREAQKSTQEIGAPPELVLPFYMINQASVQERQRIAADTTLTAEQRIAAIAGLVLQQEESLRKLLGDQAYENYRKPPETPSSP
jgi:hypothetical protein